MVGIICIFFAGCINAVKQHYFIRHNCVILCGSGIVTKNLKGQYCFILTYAGFQLQELLQRSELCAQSCDYVGLAPHECPVAASVVEALHVEQGTVQYVYSSWACTECGILL